MISRVGSLGFLSGAVRSILGKASASEPTNTYRMLDLPWFRPGRNLSQDEIVDTGFSPQPESTTYASDTLKSMPEQESSKPTGTKKPVERKLNLSRRYQDLRKQKRLLDV
jgi:hypothetical protein